jgi:hypothetical protein
VASDQVNLQAEGVGEFANALALTDQPKLRGRTERIAAHVQRRFFRRFGHGSTLLAENELPDDRIDPRRVLQPRKAIFAKSERWSGGGHHAADQQ